MRVKLQDGVQAGATFSDDGDGPPMYRYRLERWWTDQPDPWSWVAWIMLNPSTASQFEDDPTVRECQKFARRWGYSGIVVVNLFALRSTDPRQLYTHPAPVGHLNNSQIIRAATDAALVMAAWGNHGALNGRGAYVRELLIQAGLKVHHLGLTGGGAPKHPLARGKHRIPADMQPQEWSCAALNPPVG